MSCIFHRPPENIPSHVLNLADLWEALRDDCTKGIFRVDGKATKESLKPFDSRQKQITDLYKRLDNHEQGLFHYLIWLNQPQRADLCSPESPAEAPLPLSS